MNWEGKEGTGGSGSGRGGVMAKTLPHPSSHVPPHSTEQGHVCMCDSTCVCSIIYVHVPVYVCPAVFGAPECLHVVSTWSVLGHLRYSGG